jgi:GT2 family glycosyltransferase
MKKKIISIIIPVFNNIEYTKHCLSNLKNNIIQNESITNRYHIVVVDDGSKDGTGEYITENYPEIHLITGNGNLWWSGGINKGIKYSLQNINSDYVLWWNNDIRADKDYLVNLVEIIDKENNFSILIGSKVFILNKNLIWGMGGFFDANTGVKHMCAELKPDDPSLNNPISVDWFPGMGTTIHKSVFEKIGYLDEKSFPQYHGDSDFTFRAKKNGFELIAFPQLIIYNDTRNTGMLHGGSIRNLLKSMTTIKSNYNISRDIKFYRKHATSNRAYIQLVIKYFRYVGGFIKWKVFNFFNLKKSDNR